MLEASKRRVVTIPMARKMSAEGEWRENPKYDPADRMNAHAQLRMLFHARWALVWRPDPLVAESEQYAYAWEVN